MIEGTDGSTHTHGVEILLEKEDGKKWRVVQERVLSAEEMDHDSRNH